MKSAFFQRKVVLSIFVMTFFLTLNGWSHPTQETCESGTSTKKKIYVTSEQVEVTDSGIRVFTELRGEPIFVSSLSYDEKGLFFEVECYYCPFGHLPRCSVCRGCYDTTCHSRCRCNN